MYMTDVWTTLCTRHKETFLQVQIGCRSGKHLAMFELAATKLRVRENLVMMRYCLTNREHWVIASCKHIYEISQIKLVGTPVQIQHLLVKIRAKLKPSQKEFGPAWRKTDLTDNRHIQGS